MRSFWQALLSIASNVNVTDLILHTLRSFAHLTENSIYILLILAFLLAGERSDRDDAGGEGVHSQVHAHANIQYYVGSTSSAFLG